MASTIKVNNIQNQCGANIANKCGTTVTLGASGDTITLACGASQTGFGRTGTVDWDTTAKTASFTAVSGNGYFVNTTSGAITVTMPASPSAGDIVGIKDYAGTFATNNVTVGRNGSNFDGTVTDPTLSTNQLSVFFVYVDGTQGWKATQSDSAEYGAQYITATGGTITTCGDYKIHTFTGPGTFCVSCGGNAAGSNTADYLVVAGGGGGGSGQLGSSISGAGGGAGGFRVSNSYCLPAPTMSPLSNPTGLPLSVQGYPIVVGGGGAGSAQANPNAIPGTSGSNSSFSSITSTGGGGGGGRGDTTPEAGLTGGSGGGTAGVSNTAGGAGNTPPVSPPQGNPGGRNATSPGTGNMSGGGGGAGAAGGAGTPGPSLGGVGSFVSPSLAVSCAGTPGPVGSTRYFSGGGGVGFTPANSPTAGGAGGGGAGAAPGADGTAGTTNTGGGGGSGNSGCGPGPGISGAGGSGIVIIRYKFQ